jgi:carbonic anhydrase
MQKLIQGIHQFNHEVFGKNREFFERLAKEQHPQVLFITCSDSRINPNLITQTEPGELFILRNAGNIVPPFGTGSGGEAATIEYAVSVLRVTDIIVCGHSACGAMHGLMHEDALAEVPAVREWLRHAEATRRIIRENYQDLEGAARATATIEENVLVQIEHLRTHPSVASAIKRNGVRLHGWVYKLETGQVFQFEAESGQFEALRASPELEMKVSNQLPLERPLHNARSRAR